MWSLKRKQMKQNKTRFIDTEKNSGCQRGLGEIGEGDLEIQASSHRINKPRGCNKQNKTKQNKTIACGREIFSPS